MAIILIGNDFASQVYVNNKINACDTVGIKSLKYDLSENVTLTELLSLINTLNKDNSVDGILIQLPIPKHLNKELVINSVNYKKDVDGLCSRNLGALLSGNPNIRPCTSSGVMHILDNLNTDFLGKHVVVIGASNLVGKPMAIELINRFATVTICNKETINLNLISSTADIVIVAIGQPRFIKRNYIKDSAIVIDIGINRDDEDNICGDVDFDDVIDRVSYITPVPGGVGKLTVAMLMKNTVLCFQNNIYNVV